MRHDLGRPRGGDDDTARHRWAEADAEPPTRLQAPFPWFGGKSRAAPLIWQALGDCPNFVEPFFGSGAVLFQRPHPPQLETINDADSFVSNVWRALQAAPEDVAAWCDQPVHECDLHAVHTWLVNQRDTFTARLMGDPDYYDAQIAGRWLHGICMWIGSDWCSGNGPWQSVDGQLVSLGHAGHGVHRTRVHLTNAGHGVHRKRVHLGDAGCGVHRPGVHLGNAGRGSGLFTWFAALQARLRFVRVCCGDWRRVLGPSVTWKQGLTGIVLDPPYAAEENRDMRLYRVEDGEVAHAVRAWCVAHGDNALLRIVLCGYGGTHDALLPQGWTKVHWTTAGGYGNQGTGQARVNKHRETLWLSPACLTTEERQLSLFVTKETA